MIRLRDLFLVLATGIGVPVAAQLLPELPPVTAPVGAVDEAVALGGRAARDVRALADAEVARLRSLLRANPGRLETVGRHALAVSGELLLLDPDPLHLQQAAAAGFRLRSREEVAGLGIVVATLDTPAGLSLPAATRRLRRAAPGAEIATNHLFLPSGRGAARAAGTGQLSPRAVAVAGTRIGIIDTGVRAGMAGRERGFVAGAPAPGDHGTAVASLIIGGPGVQGAAPTATLVAADIYGADPTGGNACPRAGARLAGPGTGLSGGRQPHRTCERAG